MYIKKAQRVLELCGAVLASSHLPDSCLCSVSRMNVCFFLCSDQLPETGKKYCITSIRISDCCLAGDFMEWNEFAGLKLRFLALDFGQKAMGWAQQCVHFMYSLHCFKDVKAIAG